MQVCRVCLGTHVRMYYLSEHGLSAMYAQVVGFQINAEDKLPQRLCWECATRLSAAYHFIKKAWRSQHLLAFKLQISGVITTSDIESIDKAQHKLKSSLGTKLNPANDYDFKFTEETTDTNNSGDNQTSQSCNCNHNEDVSVIACNVKKEEPTVFIEVFTDNVIKNEPKDEFKEEQAAEIHQEEPHKYNADYKGASIESDNENSIVSYSEQELSIKIENTTDKNLSEMKQKRRKPVDKSSKVVEAVMSTTKSNSYDCSSCSFKTNRRGHLGQHVNSVHTKRSYFKCSFCPYMAYQRCHLRQHVNSRHTKSTSYDCSYCSYKAYQKSSLTRHVKSQHPKSTS